MLTLFLHCASDALQATVPLAAALLAARRVRRARLIPVLARAALAGAAAAWLGGYLLRTSNHQAQWEAAARVAVAGVALAIAWLCWRPSRPGAFERTRGESSVVVASAFLLLLTHGAQITSILISAFELRSLEAILSTASGAAIAVAAALAALFAARRLPLDEAAAAGRTFVVVFALQAVLAAIHLLSEARVLPFSEPIHDATEPYGPEGLWGQSLSVLLIAAPLGTAAILSIRRKFSADLGTWRARLDARVARLARATAVAILLLGQTATTIEQGPRQQAPVSGDLAALLAKPHLLFRHTGPGADYSMLGVTALDAPGNRRAASTMPCDRISFAGGSGVCLQTDRRFFAGYKALLFDSALAVKKTLKLDGSPSRTRVAADGRVGAFTVFVTGHTYAAGGFSTSTHLVDMAQGDIIADLEEFSAWKGGERIKAADVNYWGVTFKKDRNSFYVTLATGGIARLAIGDLGLRKVTVLADHVECPSISPDNRQVVFKKRVGAGGAWRLHVMDLTRMTEREIATETHYVDDQVEWLDDGHILYALRRQGSNVTDVWIATVDDSAPARIFLPEAESPVVVR